MAFISNRNMTLGDQVIERGQVIPQSVIDAIPPLRYNSLLRVKHIVEVPDDEQGELCDICGEGPFVRLARHVTAKHDTGPAVDMPEAASFPDGIDISDGTGEITVTHSLLEEE